MRSALTEGKAYRAGFTTPSCTPGPLEEIGRMGWRIVHGDGRQATDIHTHLHGGRTAQQVEFAGLELVFTVAQRGAGDLGGMFDTPKVGAEAGNTVIDVAPRS